MTFSGLILKLHLKPLLMVKSIHDIELYRDMLRIALSYFANVPETELEEFITIFELKFYPKKSIIIAPNNTDLKGYFIVRGLVRMYYIAHDTEITSDFRDSNSFFLNGYKIYAKQDNFDYFVALEDTICLVADWNELEELLSKYHSLERMGRKIIEWHYTESMRVSYNTLFMDTEQRYSTFMKERAALINRVPLKYIASYLGIAKETLSRLRNKVKH